MWDEKEASHARKCVADILCVLEDDHNRPGLKETPKRVVESWRELFAGYDDDPAPYFKKFDDAERYDGMVLFRKLLVQSFCEHHMLPFSGHAWIAYIPKNEGHVLGASKMSRVLRVYTRRLQMQERIGQQVIKAINDNLEVKGAACLIRATHLCMACRGVKEPESDMVTNSMSGVFRTQPAVRKEFLDLVRI